MGESVKHETVHGHMDGGVEERLFVETDPVGIMVIRHGLLNYSTHPTTLSFIPADQSQMYPF
jgi:hypothetical protein